MSRSLADLRPEIRPMVDRFLDATAAAGMDLLVTSTYRSFSEQTALYARGRTEPGPIVTRAKAGDSPHNWGLALDFVPVVDGKPEWSGTDPVWQVAGEMAELAGLEWGGSWAKFPDYGHVQHPRWRLLAQQLEA